MTGVQTCALPIYRYLQDTDSRLSVPFESDELAVHEYRRTFERRTPLEPERRLMLAVLEDAIFCFQRYLHAEGSKQKKLHQHATTWIFDPSDSRAFSFENICETCGLDPDYLRMGLLKWQERMTSIKNSMSSTNKGCCAGDLSRSTIKSGPPVSRSSRRSEKSLSSHRGSQVSYCRALSK